MKSIEKRIKEYCKKKREIIMRREQRLNILDNLSIAQSNNDVREVVKLKKLLNNFM